MSSLLPRVVVGAPLVEGALTPLEAVTRLEVLEAGASRTELLAALADTDAFVPLLSQRVDDEILEHAPRLRIVASYAVGFDNIDLEAARARGIWVTNTPDVLTEATADIAMGLILATMRRFAEAERSLRAGGFRGWSPTYMLGRSLARKRLGIVGCGRIGRALGERARAFGMEVVCAARAGQSATIDAAADAPARVPLETLLETSDVISLHLPLVSETRHLIDRAAIARMRDGAYVVNTARGPVIDEEALAEALETGKLAGAGLDVYEREPEVHPRLLAAPHTVLLPHLGSATVETRIAMGHLVAENVTAVLGGARPPCVVVEGKR